ncbi:hypothetical protein BROUX41_002629 [Berkeleyomyces rouxiae]
MRTPPPPLIRIANGTFFRHHPAAKHAAGRVNPPLFAGLDFTLPATPGEAWAVVGPSLSGKTTFLQALRGLHLCEPPTARAFPLLSSPAVPARLRAPIKAIQYVGFDADAGPANSVTTSAYLSARYESRREETDFALRAYLVGATDLNPSAPLAADAAVPLALLARVVDDLRLGPLLDLPVAFLSNGQGRRARIARALIDRPEALLLDEPFMGLDPPTVAALSPLLRELAARAAPRLVLSARPQDALPDWITHLVLLRDDCRVAAVGPRAAVLGTQSTHASADVRSAPAPPSSPTSSAPPAGAPVVEMQGCVVRYGAKAALGNWPGGLHWTVRAGTRWAIFGPNGSGKTTLVALLTSDHPQTYALPIRLFGRSRLPQPGTALPPLTFWDVQARVGHASPEVHQHMPRRLTLRAVLASAWAPTFAAPPAMTPEAHACVDAALRAFERELNPEAVNAAKGDEPRPESSLRSTAWADAHLFGQVSFSAQRVALLLRAVIKRPEIVVLDEAFGGMDARTREKCMRLLRDGPGDGSADDAGVGVGDLPGLAPRQALICISHVREEVPDSVREWMCLPEANSGCAARFGRMDGPLAAAGARAEEQWRQIWGM